MGDFSFFRLLRQICIFSWKCSFFFIKKRRKIELTFTVGSYCLLSLFLSFLGFCFTLSGFFCRIFFRKSQFLLFQFFLQLSDLLCPFLRPDLSAELFINPKKDLCVMMIIDTSNTRTMITTPPTVPNADAVEMQTAPPSTPPPVWYSELSA